MNYTYSIPADRGDWPTWFKSRYERTRVTGNWMWVWRNTYSDSYVTIANGGIVVVFTDESQFLMTSLRDS